MVSSAGAAGRAIILKGPLASSKSFFTVLPSSLDELVAKASALFPVPQGHTGQLVLDNGAILMPDVLPFLLEREVLTFRHAPDTPRSSLKRVLMSTDGAKSASHGATSCASSNAHHLGSDDNIGSSGGSSSSRGSRSVRWSDSVVCPNDKARMMSAAALPPAKPAKYSAAGRAEHARRVLGEQEQRRRQEEATAMGQEATSTSVKSQRKQSPASSDAQKGSSMHKAHAKDTFFSESNTSTTDAGARNLAHPFKGMTMNDLLVSGSSPPSYASATTSSATHTRINSEDEQQGSSPVASPTRNIRGAQRQGAEWMKPLGESKESKESEAGVINGTNKNEPEERKTVIEEGASIDARAVAVADADDSLTATDAQRNEKGSALKETDDRDDDAEKANETSAKTDQLSANGPQLFIEADIKRPSDNSDPLTTAVVIGNDEEDERAVEQAVIPAPSPRKEMRTAAAYQRMISIIDTLQSHPANVFFRQPICFDDDSNGFAHFLQRTGRPVVDFHTLRKNLDERRYGNKDPLAAISADLDDMWASARAYFGPSSNQGRCADFMERFGKVVMAEWRREAEKKSGEDNVKSTAAEEIVKPHRRNNDPAAKFIRSVANRSSKSAMPRALSNVAKQNSPRMALTQRTEQPSSHVVESDKYGAKGQYTNRSEVSASALHTASHPSAFVAEMSGKSHNGVRQTKIAEEDAIARLQKQFGPFTHIARDNAGTRNKGPKRPNQWDTTGGRKKARNVHSAGEPAQVTSVEVPVVTVTDESAVAETLPAKEPRQAPAQHETEAGLESSKLQKEAQLPSGKEAEAESFPSTDVAANATDPVEEEKSTPRSSPRTKKQQQQGGGKTRTSPRFRAGRNHGLSKADAISLGGSTESDDSFKSATDRQIASPGRIGTRATRRAQTAVA